MAARKPGTIFSGEEQLVAATEIVRNFSAWQERCTHRPIYILHHGRPRSVLLSLDLYGRLLASQGPQSASERQLRVQMDLLLAHMGTMFAQADRELRIVRVNRAAAAFLGCNPRSFEKREIAELFGDAMVKAAREALIEGHCVGTTIHDGRHLTFQIIAFPPALGLFWSDVTEAQVAVLLTSERETAETLLSMMTGCAIGEVSPDGLLRSAHPSLIRLLRMRASLLARTPFCDLFEDGSRRKCRLHLAHVFEGKGPVRCRVEILTRDRGPVPVRLFMAPRMADQSVESAAFSILDDAMGALPMR